MFPERAALLCALRTIAAGLLAVALPVATAAQAVSEPALKAACIYNFALFTEWPAAALAPDASLTICVHPASQLGAALADLNIQTIRGHQLLIQSTPNLRSCHIVLLDALDRPELARIKQMLQGSNVLTITDMAAPAPGDAIIALAVADQHIVFDIDLTAAHQAQLRISSKLLRLARNIQ